MNILLSSHFFHPSVGGIEAVSSLLAHEFIAAGHEVRVVTATPAEDRTRFAFEVYRRPRPWTLLRLVRWCDVFFHNNISLQTAWPLLIAKRPWVVAHHTWISRPNGRLSLRDHLKKRVLRAARNISVSRAIAEQVGATCRIIGNPFEDSLFRTLPGGIRDRELIFVGRLVSDKGLDILLESLCELRVEGLRPRLTIVGTGPEEPALRERVARLDLERQVQFAGCQTGEALVALLNRHRIIVIPSRWNEPFGVVALEGIACGCVPLGANCGGLPDAIGPCGALFERASRSSLTQALTRLLADETCLDRFRNAAAEHLASHTAKRVAAEYLGVLQKEAAR